MPANEAANSDPSAEILSPDWEEIQPFTQPIDMKPGEECVGYYRGANEVTVPDPNSEDEDGKRTNLLHEFSETLESEPFGIWGSGGLDKRLADVTIGSYCRVLYEGKTDLSGGRTARQYRVWVDRKAAF